MIPKGKQSAMSSPQEDHPLENTGSLIARAQAGDEAARAEVLQRYREPLARFLHGRLSHEARAMQDTDDLVQEALKAAHQKFERFEYRGMGSFWAYLRRIGINLVLQAHRQPGPPHVGQGDTAFLNGKADSSNESPSEAMLREERKSRIEEVLESMPEQVRNAFLLRIEVGLSYELIARECGYPSPGAARMAIVRATASLATELADLKP